jgi:hypothetical protein
MEDEVTREEENSAEPIDEFSEESVSEAEPESSEASPDVDEADEAFEDVADDEVPDEEPGEGGGKALQKSIGLGLPSDRFRVVLPKGSFPPLSVRQQFIARLRDRDKVSFRIFQGDEDLASQNDLLVEIGLVGIALNNEDKAFLELDFHLNLELMLRVRLMDKFGEKEAFAVLDMAKGPKTIIHQDSMVLFIERMESLERRITEIGEKLDSR